MNMTGGSAAAFDVRGEIARDGRPRSLEPIVVLTYAHSGSELLTQVLAANRKVACTSGTGILPLCYSAAVSWQALERRGTKPSALALSSIRALLGQMIAVLSAETGASCWCETAFAAPAAAETFLQVFPAARFVCVHRSLESVLREGIEGHPLGLGGTAFWPYATGHPGNNVATIAAYWTANTEALLEFENMHPQSCLRVRHEDLADDASGAVNGVLAFLGLNPRDHALLPDPISSSTAVNDASERGRVPLSNVPSHLLARVKELYSRLDYPLPVLLDQ